MSRIGWQAPEGEKQAVRTALAPIALLAALALTAALALCTNALALSAPVNVGTPFDINALSVAVDASGTAYIAWANDKDLPPTTTDVVQYCVLPVDATGCTHEGTLTPADGAVATDNVQVLVDGSTVVVLADVFGAKGSEAGDYTPEQEWQSTDGGATFTAVNGGKSVASGILDADTAPLSAVILPGTNVLGYGWNTAGSSPPTFSAFPLTSPPECSVKTCPAGFASLEPNTNPDQIGNAGGAFASTPSGPGMGVLGIFNTNFTNGPLGCAESFGTAYTYGSGAQSPANNYNISPGSPNSAWRVPVSQADCNAEYPAVTGGPSGFGVIEDNLGTNDTVYHRFDQTTEKFDTPLVTIAPEFEEQPSVSQDAAGGVYATYLAGFGGQVRIAYSYNGGNTWSGPATLNADEDGSADDLTSTVSEMGQGWAAWIDNGSVYAQPFDAADTIASAPTALTTSQTAGAASGANIAISAGTVGESDHATITGTNAGEASGTMDYGLYSASGCPAASRVLTSVVAVTSGVAAPSAAVPSSLAPGTYYWRAAYSGNAGTDLGAKGNEASSSACGSETLTVIPPTLIPSGAYTVESIVANSDGTVTITLIPTQSGAANLVVTVPTASIASVAAVESKAKKCKHGQVKLKGKCRPASTAVGKTSGKGTAGAPLKLVVHLSGKIKAQLAKGKTVHLTATLTYTSALGGKATVHTYQLTVKGHKRGKGKK